MQVDHDSGNRVTRVALQALRDQSVFLPRLYGAAVLAGVSRRTGGHDLVMMLCAYTTVASDR